MKSLTGHSFRKILALTTIVLSGFFTTLPCEAQENTATVAHEVEHDVAAAEHKVAGEIHEVEENLAKKFDPGKTILDHVVDAHDWHIAGEGHGSITIPLPIIIYSNERGLDVFMSSNFQHGHETYKGYMLEGNKIVAVNEMESISAHSATVNEEVTHNLYDMSLTKNATAILISCIIIFLLFMSVAKAYTRRQGMAPKGFQSLIEPLVLFVRDDIAKDNIGEKKYKKYVPFLLTIFFFIWINNLLGLIPIFPGGANITGSISVTMALALMVLVITTLSGTKDYWRHIFAMPGVPIGVLFILTPIEIIGVFLKPFVLMIRLFANMTAGHIIALAFFSLIFIFGEMSPAGGYGVALFSLAFTIFMGVLELLVAFLQAYVFTLLAAMYFGGAAAEHDHSHDHAHDAKHA